MFVRTTPNAIASILLAPTLLLATCIAGCGEAPDRTDPLAKIAENYRKALREHPAIPTSDDSSNTSQQLRNLARQAGSAGRDGDAAAGSILAAGIHAKAGSIDLNLAEDLQSKSNITMDQISGLVENVIILDNSANSRENLNLGSSMSFLSDSRAKAKSILSESESQLDELRQPIDSATAERDNRSQRASEYERQAAELAQRGIDAGPLDGQLFVKESIDLRRLAHAERIGAAREEITLGNFEPQERLASQNVENGQNLLDAARTSESNSQEQQNTAADWADTVRSDIEDIKGRINPLLQQLASAQTQGILPLYEAAAQDFASSANAAQSSTRGGSQEQTNAGWLAVASGHLGEGRVHWAMASSLNAQATLLAQLVISGDLIGDNSRWTSEMESTISARDEAIKVAEASFQEAVTSLANVRGKGTNTEGIRSQIELAIQAVQGADLIGMADSRMSGSTSTPRTNSGANQSASRQAAPVGPPGFASPQAAADTFNNLPANMAGLQHMLNSVKASQPNPSMILTMAKNALSAFEPAVNACMQKFGNLGTTSPFEQIQASGTPTNITVKSESGNSAILVDSEDGTEVSFTKQNGRWFMDLDSTMETAMQESPEMEQMLPMVGMMVNPLIKQIRDASQQVAQGIQSGQYATADAAMSAMSDKVGEIVGGLLGGMMGGGGMGGMGGGMGGMGGGFPGMGGG